jgi:hypothetical protein
LAAAPLPLSFRIYSVQGAPVVSDRTVACPSGGDIVSAESEFQPLWESNTYE